MNISPAEASRLRLVAQRLVGPGAASAHDAVRHLTGMQAQDRPGALVSVALRTRARSLPAVHAALDAGQVVTSWPMRGTLHLVAAEDLPWMLALTAPRVVAGQAARRRQLEISDKDVEQARATAVAALSGGGRLSRAELLRRWAGAGQPTTGQRGYHLLAHLSQTGTLCLGPLHAGEQQFVLLDEWVPAPRQLSGDEALGEFALRYFRGHGPATVTDLARWGRLTAADARTGVTLASPALDGVVVDGATHWLDPAGPELLARHREAVRGVLLLPGFDEFMLGYGDRSAALPAAFADRIVPGGNGIFRPTVVVDGQVVGTWRHAPGRGRKAPPSLELQPFTPLGADVRAAAEQAHAELPR